MPVVSETSPQASGVQPKRRLKLVMPSKDPPAPHSSSPATGTDKELSGSPTRPSYSPVTPTLSQTSLTFPPGQTDAFSATQWIEEPEALPVSLDDNSDAVALRAAISILQMQRQQSQRDIRHLDKLKHAALEDPEAFVNDLKAGNLTSEPRAGVDIDLDSDDSLDADPVAVNTSASSKFGKFPAAQNVVRAPPIEWSKYHVVGEPLDRLHEVQRQYPGWNEEMMDTGDQPQPHAIAAPYRAFSDRLDEHPSVVRKEEQGT